MTKQVDFERYEKFVDAVTSDASTDFVALLIVQLNWMRKVPILNVS